LTVHSNRTRLAALLGVIALVHPPIAASANTHTAACAASSGLLRALRAQVMTLEAPNSEHYRQYVYGYGAGAGAVKAGTNDEESASGACSTQQTAHNKIIAVNSQKKAATGRSKDSLAFQSATGR
jgi:hypothetical protein